MMHQTRKMEIRHYSDARILSLPFENPHARMAIILPAGLIFFFYSPFLHILLFYRSHRERRICSNKDCIEVSQERKLQRGSTQHVSN